MTNKGQKQLPNVCMCPSMHSLLSLLIEGAKTSGTDGRDRAMKTTFKGSAALSPALPDMMGNHVCDRGHCTPQLFLN